jgi:DNA-binding transcriptional regulator LsrR (DeoR family)
VRKTAKKCEGKKINNAFESPIMKEGWLASNPNKVRLLELILKGAIEREEIAKKIRLPRPTIDSLMNELISDGFVKLNGNVYEITEEGEKALKSLKEDVGGKRK